MTVTFGNWRIVPYQTNGMRCWQVFQVNRKEALRYYDRLSDALIFCAEYDMRNKVEGTFDLRGALTEYASIRDSIVQAVREAGE